MGSAYLTQLGAASYPTMLRSNVSDPTGVPVATQAEKAATQKDKRKQEQSGQAFGQACKLEYGTEQPEKRHGADYR